MAVAPSQGETPLGTAFTYQGQLKESGAPFDGTADFQFTLWDAAGSGDPPTGGIQVGGVQAINALPVTAGLFTVTLNAASEFGPNAFSGNARWLQVAVRSPAGSGSFTTLAPRQPLTAAPHALSLRLPFAETGPSILATGSAFSITSSNGGAIVGTTANVAGNVTALTGFTPAPSGVGVFGRATSTTGVNYGGWFQSFSATGYGVQGNATSTTGVNYGVYGTSASPQGFGVWGESVDNAGVNGFASGSSGINYGVVGQSASTEGRGVYGNATAATGYAGYFTGGRNYFGGNVGIGTATPAVKLHVEGGSDTAPGGGGYLVTGSTTSTNISIDNNEIMARNNGQVATLTLNANGGDIVCGGAIDIGYEIRVSDRGVTDPVTVTCSPGKKVLGGGCLSNSLDQLEFSFPDNNGTAWTCYADGWTVTAYAICANVK